MAVEVVRSSSVTGVRLPLRSRLGAEEAVLLMRGDSRPFALVGDWLSGLCVLGSEPVCTAGLGEDPFAVLERMPQFVGGLVDGLPEVAVGSPEAGGHGHVPLVGGGWVGWLGYGLGGLIECLPPAPPAPVPRPPFSLAFYDHVIVFDGEQWWFEALWSEGRSAVLRARLALWESRLAARAVPGEPATTSPFRLAGAGAAGHTAAVAECLERITAGELFQANLCLRLESRLSGDPIDLFARALPVATPRFGALVDGAVSLSPERFLLRRGRSVSTEPIKGTRPRAPGPGPGDERAAREALEALVASAKDAAEHVMIVDLMRNDLGRVCEYGTVRAEPARPEAHAGVWHLVSTVSGRLRDGVGDRDLLRAAFPPGSVTGAPKVQAMKVISELEASRRELYTGAIGIVSPLAGLDMSVAIRTFEISGDTIWFGAGGGIVADSNPELELAEALTKARGPVASIGGTVAAPTGVPRPRPRRRSVVPGVSGVPGVPGVPRALAHGTRPNPIHGVFETMLVKDRGPVLLEQHLSRLSASLQRLYDVALDLGAAGLRVTDAAFELGAAAARLRVLADPDGSISVTVSGAGGVAGFGGVPSERMSLKPFALPGGLGAHKWRDRALLDALSALEADTVPLLVDGDGAVLEAAHANVWIIEGEALITPPADGRLLPGVTRATLLASDGRAREESFDLIRMAQADSIFLTSSISGRRSVTLGARRPAGER